MIASDWWTNILTGATPAAPELDHPANVTTLRRIASDYDMVGIVSPNWHTVGTQVRDRLKAYAAEQGTPILCMRYMGSMSVLRGDQTGDMQLIPASGRVTTTGEATALDTLLKSDGSPMPERGFNGYLVDPGSASALAAAKSNVLAKASGWDGVFIDEVVDTYATYRGDNTKVADGYPVGATAYPDAKKAFVAAVTQHLASNGYLVAANITPYATPSNAKTYPQQLCEAASGLKYPFIEAEFGTDWGGAVIGQESGSWTVQQDIAGFLAWCQANEREPIPNVYSNSSGAISYGLGVFLAHAGADAFFSAHCPDPDFNDEYAREPTSVPDFAVAEALGAPVAAPVGANVVTRAYQGGRVAYNPSASSRTLTLDGYYATSGETGRATGNRVMPALTSLILNGSDFGTYRQVNGKKGRGHYMWGGGRWNRLVAPNEYVGPALPAGAAIASDAFAGDDGAAWDPGRWATGMALASSTATIIGNRGQLKVGTTSPGVRTQRFIGSQFADFHALFTFSLSAPTSLTVMFRSGDTTLDEVDSYGLRLWADQMELVSFDQSYSGTQIAQAPKSHTPGQQFYLRLKAAGPTLQARSWFTDDTEPASWDIDVSSTAKTSAGWFGFSAAGYGASGPNSTVTIDALTVAAS